MKSSLITVANEGFDVSRLLLLITQTILALVMLMEPILLSLKIRL
jgi:hypothetical protein